MVEIKIIVLLISSYLLIVNSTNIEVKNICYGKPSGLFLDVYNCEGNLKSGGWLKIKKIKIMTGKEKSPDNLLIDPNISWYKRGVCNTYYFKTCRLS